MLSAFLSRLVILTVGTLYPAYRSYKAVRTKDVKEYVKWMMYWIVFALFSCCESLADILVAFWFPFYYEIKVLFVIWLLSPWTRGSSILYRKWVHPMFVKHEPDIDSFLDQAKSEGYRQVFNIGTRGIMCARSIVASAALRGMNDLHRSLSMGDVSNTGRDKIDRIFNNNNKTRVAQIQEIHEEEEETDEGEEGGTEVGEKLFVGESSQRRTWVGYYDEQNQIIEQQMDEHITTIDNEELIVIDDPNPIEHTSSEPNVPKGRSGTSGAGNRRRGGSRGRPKVTGLADDEVDQKYNTLPRRSTRRTGQNTSSH